MFRNCIAFTKYREECYCGKTYGLYSMLPESSCFYPCDGDPTQICGGDNALSIWGLYGNENLVSFIEKKIDF